MSQQKYKMSFSVGGLCVPESCALAKVYFNGVGWSEVLIEALQSNLLQQRTAASSQRLLAELISRLKNLSKVELDVLDGGSSEEKRAVLWLAVCRTYTFIGEFCKEAVFPGFLSFDLQLSYSKFDAFFAAKLEWHPELENIKPSTYVKLRQVTFKMMREAGLINLENQVLSPLLSSVFVNRIKDNNPADLEFLLGT